jgi:hypothetical protein
MKGSMDDLAGTVGTLYSNKIVPWLHLDAGFEQRRLFRSSKKYQDKSSILPSLSVELPY